jgi:methylmalonyl-CoA/ethylmalonyl-CoA epimerase
VKFHHLGYGTNSIDESSKYFGKLGYVPEGDVFEDSKLGIKGLFMVGAESHRIELVENLTEKSVIDSWLKNGSPFYHVAFEVSKEKFENSDEIGKTIIPPTNAVAFGGRRIKFILSKNKTLIELIELDYYN